MKQETHRPGALKQSNKQHKTGRHRSKSVINNFKGKRCSYRYKLSNFMENNILFYFYFYILFYIPIGKQNVIKITKRFKRDLQKDARRNQLLQIRKKKREEVLAQKRNLSGSSSAPFLICVIPLQRDVNIKNITSVITNVDETANIATSSCGVTHIRYVANRIL